MEKQREDEIWCLAAGMVSSGKSRFFNTLFPGLGLPVGILPMTAAPTFLRFGREAVEVTTDQGRTVRERFEALCGYSRKWNTPGEKLCRLDVYLEESILEQGLVFVDMPGFGTMEQAEDMFFRLLPKADAVFYFLEKGMTLEDRAYLDEIAKQNRKLVVIRAKIDQIHCSEEKVEEVLREEEREILARYPRCRVYFVTMDQEMEEDQMELIRAYIRDSLRGDAREARRIRQSKEFMEELAARQKEIADRLKQEEDDNCGNLERTMRRRLSEVDETLSWAKAQIEKTVDETKRRCRMEGVDALSSARPDGGWPGEEQLGIIMGHLSGLCQWYREYVEKLTGRNLLEDLLEKIWQLPDREGTILAGQQRGILESRQQYKRLVNESFGYVKDSMVRHFQMESRRVRRGADREQMLISQILDMDRQITRRNLQRELAAVEEELEILAQAGGDG